MWCQIRTVACVPGFFLTYQILKRSNPMQVWFWMSFTLILIMLSLMYLLTLGFKLGITLVLAYCCIIYWQLAELNLWIHCILRLQPLADHVLLFLNLQLDLVDCCCDCSSAGVACLLVPVMPKHLVLPMAIMGKFGADGAFSEAYIYTSEMFPTVRIFS